MRRRNIPSWLYYTVVGLPRAASGCFLWKNLFLKISRYPHETPVLKSLFKNVASLEICNLIKKRPQQRCFPVNITKFLRLSISKKIACFFTVSMVYCYMDLSFQGLDCMTVSGLRVRVFCFKSASLFLNQFPTCFRKPKTNSFDESITFMVVLDSFRSF